jgi:exonuclease SbcD
MKILCTGDLHLGAGADYGREPSDRLRDQENVLVSIAQVAREEDVDVVLIAGDVFDRPRPDPDVLRVFDRFVDRVTDDSLGIDCDVLAITGNAGHDVRNAETYAALELFARRIDVRRMPALWQTRGLAVATLPSVPVSRLVASRNGGDRSAIHQDAADYLVQVARDLRAEIPEGTPAILLGHWSVSGASLPNGLPTDALNEPVLPLEDLAGLGFDAIALGHIHRSQMLYRRPEIFYVGSPMPLNFGEVEPATVMPGSYHGVTILDNAHGYFEARHVAIESRAFVTIAADLTRAHEADASPVTHDGQFDTSDFGPSNEGAKPEGLEPTNIIAAACEEHFPLDEAIVRLRVKATAEQWRRVDQAALRRLCIDAGTSKIYAISADVVREDRARVAGLDESIDELGALDAYIEANQLNGKADALRERTARYLEETRA